MSSSLAVLLEVKTTRSSAVLSFHLSQCFTPPLRSIPTSFFPHVPCPPSWVPSLSAILTPVLRMCHLFKTTYAALGACLSTDPIWLGNFLRRGKSLKGGRTRRISSESGRFSSRLECEASMWLLANGLRQWCHFLTGCVLFWEMDPVFFGWERVNPLCGGGRKK